MRSNYLHDKMRRARPFVYSVQIDYVYACCRHCDVEAYGHVTINTRVARRSEGP
jgi:hypothetical protein